MTRTIPAVASEAELRALYKTPHPGAVAKEIARLDAHCRRFIALSPFLCLASQSQAGRGDVSPRGGEPGFVHVLQDRLLALPDRPGNNRLDNLANLVGNPAVALVFFVPGVEETLRVNGRARITTAPELMTRFMVDGKAPKAVVLVDVEEAQLHCAKAIRRARLWDAAAQQPREALPATGEILRDHARLDADASVVEAYAQADLRDNLY